MGFPESVTGKMYKCDRCNESFPGESVTLRECSGNVQILTPVNMIMVVSKDNSIHAVGSPQLGDRTLHCPKCGEWHPNGFNRA